MFILCLLSARHSGMVGHVRGPDGPAAWRMSFGAAAKISLNRGSLRSSRTQGQGRVRPRRSQGRHEFPVASIHRAAEHLFTAIHCLGGGFVENNDAGRFFRTAEGRFGRGLKNTGGSGASDSEEPAAARITVCYPLTPM